MEEQGQVVAVGYIAVVDVVVPLLLVGVCIALEEEENLEGTVQYLLLLPLEGGVERRFLFPRLLLRSAG